MRRDYEYRGLIATTWDLLRGDASTWADRPFYLEALRRSGEPALDVGCGTGRLLLDYLAQGIDIDGVDNSPEMLALCREKARLLGLRPSVFEQHMETLDLPRRYRTIIVPSSSFQLLTEPADAAEAMRRFFHHLEPRGTLLMPFLVPHEMNEDWRLVREALRPEDGARVRRWSRSRRDTATQLEHTWDRFEILRGDAVVAREEHSRSPAVRWYTQAQARELYGAAGFVDVRVVQGFTAEPASEDSTLFSVFGTRPA